MGYATAEYTVRDTVTIDQIGAGSDEWLKNMDMIASGLNFAPVIAASVGTGNGVDTQYRSNDGQSAGVAL